MIKQKNYQVCNHCVMDTTDEYILFDENGVCERCNGGIMVRVMKKNLLKLYLILRKKEKGKSMTVFLD